MRGDGAVHSCTRHRVVTRDRPSKPVTVAAAANAGQPLVSACNQRSTIVVRRQLDQCGVRSAGSEIHPIGWMKQRIGGVGTLEVAGPLRACSTSELQSARSVRDADVCKRDVPHDEFGHKHGCWIVNQRHERFADGSSVNHADVM